MKPTKIKLYIDSLNKFIHDNHNSLFDQIIISECDYELAIVVLTLINNVSKKTKTYIHGYYIATLILLLQHTNCDLLELNKLLYFHTKMMIQYTTSEQMWAILTNCMAIVDAMFKNKNNNLKIIELAFMLSWILGFGDLHNKQIANQFKIVSNNFYSMRTIANSFDTSVYNEMYDKFITSKTKFIEIMITLELYTDTIKEIVNNFENRIDNS